MAWPGPVGELLDLSLPVLSVLALFTWNIKYCWGFEMSCIIRLEANLMIKYELPIFYVVGYSFGLEISDILGVNSLFYGQNVAQ